MTHEERVLKILASQGGEIATNGKAPVVNILAPVIGLSTREIRVLLQRMAAKSNSPIALQYESGIIVTVRLLKEEEKAQLALGDQQSSKHEIKEQLASRITLAWEALTEYENASDVLNETQLSRYIAQHTAVMTVRQAKYCLIYLEWLGSYTRVGMQVGFWVEPEASFVTASMLMSEKDPAKLEAWRQLAETAAGQIWRNGGIDILAQLDSIAGDRRSAVRLVALLRRTGVIYRVVGKDVIRDSREFRLDEIVGNVLVE